MEMDTKKVAKNIKRYLDSKNLKATETTVRGCLKPEVSEADFKAIYHDVLVLDGLLVENVKQCELCGGRVHRYEHLFQCEKCNAIGDLQTGIMTKIEIPKNEASD